MNTSTEKQILRAALNQLGNEGYDVFIEPAGIGLPAFLQGIRPDAVAFKSTGNLVVEVISDTLGAQSKIEVLQRILEGQKDWKLKIIWASPKMTGVDISVQSDDSVRARIAQMRTVQEGSPELALLLGWATFEALARRLAPGMFDKPQSPGRLVEKLAGDGFLTPDEADWLRDLAQLRNRFIHGGLDIQVSPEKIPKFASILEALIQQVQ